MSGGPGRSNRSSTEITTAVALVTLVPFVLLVIGIAWSRLKGGETFTGGDLTTVALSFVTLLAVVITLKSFLDKSEVDRSLARLDHYQDELKSVAAASRYETLEVTLAFAYLALRNKRYGPAREFAQRGLRHLSEFRQIAEYHPDASLRNIEATRNGEFLLQYYGGLAHECADMPPDKDEYRPQLEEALEKHRAATDLLVRHPGAFGKEHAKWAKKAGEHLAKVREALAKEYDFQQRMKPGSP